MVKIHGPKYRFANRLIRHIFGRASLKESDLLAKAVSLTGLTDWGGQAFKEPLRVLLGSLEDEACLNDLGRHYARREILRILSNRLLIQDTLKKNPDIEKVSINRPLIITGLARSGTTYLHRLLAQDPSARTLQIWELQKPVPPPSIESYHSDRRRKLLRRARWLSRVFVCPLGSVSQINAVHETRSDDPEECWYLFQPEFLTNTFALFSRMPSYIEWMADAEMREAYQYYFRALQLLLWRYSAEQLVVKSPEHLRYLDSLFRVFPDAQIIWVHRDPLKTIPSKCSLLSNFRQFRSYHRRPREIGRLVLQTESQKIERALQVRTDVGESQFCDVFSSQLRKSPLEVVRRIYSAAGYRFSEEAKNRMESWIESQRTRNPGRHSYQLSTFELTSEQVNQSFSAYRRRFSIPVE
jgi:hypothetical protein